MMRDAIRRDLDLLIDQEPVLAVSLDHEKKSCLFSCLENSTQTTLSECDAYIEDQCSKNKVNPLDYWKCNANTFLCIQSSSVAVEHMFRFADKITYQT